MASNGNTFKSARTVELPLASQAPLGGALNSNLGNMLNQTTATSLGLIDRQIEAQNALAGRALQYQLFQKGLSDITGVAQIGANPPSITPTNFGIPTGGGGGALYA